MDPNLNKVEKRMKSVVLIKFLHAIKGFSFIFDIEFMGTWEMYEFTLHAACLHSKL